MTKIAFILTIGLLVSGCNNMKTNSSASIPENIQPNWAGLDIDSFPVKFGQILKFDKDSEEIRAIVLDISEDEGGQWIGVTFLDQNRLFGRQIPSGLVDTECLDLLDVTYIKVDGQIDFEVLETIKVNKTNVGIGSRSPATSLSEIKRNYNRGIEQRKKDQTPCDKALTELNPVNECYFEIEKIKN
ncbi:MAG: hypothetical protein N4A41_05765 [Crocinitomicaceae bacterium]|jgi:hypothetical protein|nr:hypothetical protein [Crocinitomicaceae bacterium]